jgi:hypothetical protein
VSDERADVRNGAADERDERAEQRNEPAEHRDEAAEQRNEPAEQKEGRRASVARRISWRRLLRNKDLRVGAAIAHACHKIKKCQRRIPDGMTRIVTVTIHV